MKNLVILVIVAALGYFGFNAFNGSETVSQEAIGSQVTNQEGLEDIAVDLESEEEIETESEVVAQAVASTDPIEEGVTDLAETDIEVVAESQSAGPGKYIAYEDTTLASLEGDIVLDFYASWCPSCRKLEADIKDSLNDIPSDLNIVVVDYDNETALKSKYGVTQQHTLVQVDQQGNLIKKWSGGSTLESVVSEVI